MDVAQRLSFSFISFVTAACQLYQKESHFLFLSVVEMEMMLIAAVDFWKYAA